MLPQPPPFQSLYRPSRLRARELAVTALGVEEWMAPGMVDRPRGTGDWLLMAFHQDVVIGHDGVDRLVPGPSLMVWSRGRGHHYGRRDARWCHSWMHADGRAVARAMAEAAVPLDRPLSGVPTRVLEQAVAAMHDEIERHAEPDPAIVELHLRALARAIARAAHARVPAVPERWLAARLDLEQSLADRPSLAALAARAGCSVPHFCAEFRRWFHQAPIAFAIRARMERAAALLRDRNRGVKQVAAEVGYDDLHHFSKLFKKHHGVAPRALRARLLADDAG